MASLRIEIRLDGALEAREVKPDDDVDLGWTAEQFLHHLGLGRAEPVMVQRIGLRANRPLPMGRRLSTVGVREGDLLRVRPTYDTTPLSDLYSGDGIYVDATRAGLAQGLVPVDLPRADFVRLALQKLCDAGQLPALFVLAATRWRRGESLRQPVLRDVAEDFERPALACPTCWPGLRGYHDALNALWEELRSAPIGNQEGRHEQR